MSFIRCYEYEHIVIRLIYFVPKYNNIKYSLSNAANNNVYLLINIFIITIMDKEN